MTEEQIMMQWASAGHQMVIDWIKKSFIFTCLCSISFLLSADGEELPKSIHRLLNACVDLTTDNLRSKEFWDLSNGFKVIQWRLTPDSPKIQHYVRLKIQKKIQIM